MSFKVYLVILSAITGRPDAAPTFTEMPSIAACMAKVAQALEDKKRDVTGGGQGNSVPSLNKFGAGCAIVRTGGV